MSTDPDELRARIAEERVALGETAAALAARTDVIGRAKDGAHDAAESLRDNASQTVTQAREQSSRAVERARTWSADIIARARSGEGRKPLFVVGAMLGALVAAAALRAVRGR
ncbi:hypothetical protein GCM10009836_03620 [Pseudonocardia ailaonensis]|uniref:DUF3618 domain-containing protein n=1 Tax=Pseudonocardia ailaonensis TaxID=367279 RepID=A0ABN2MKH0_9PSEU